MSGIRGVAGDAAGIDGRVVDGIVDTIHGRSEEHTSELQSL